MAVKTFSYVLCSQSLISLIPFQTSCLNQLIYLLVLPLILILKAHLPHSSLVFVFVRCGLPNFLFFFFLFLVMESQLFGLIQTNCVPNSFFFLPLINVHKHDSHRFKIWLLRNSRCLSVLSMRTRLIPCEVQQRRATSIHWWWRLNNSSMILGAKKEFEHIGGQIYYEHLLTLGEFGMSIRLLKIKREI